MSAAALDVHNRGRVGPLLFAVAIFTSAMLVFTVEPMVTKLVLPLLGGSAAVWNTAVVFFQAALLGGYAYAHLLQRIQSLRVQLMVHLVLLVIAAGVLPLHVTGLFGEPDTTRPILWLLGVLTLSIGAPFAVLSATAPLLQAWYARVRAGQPDAANPYALYAASNLGSFISLLAYPVLVEPLLTLKGQALGWTLGYGLFFVLAAMLAAYSWGTRAAPPPAPLERSAPIPWRTKLVWVLLAAAPSSLMLGVTQHLTTDIASVPFLWIIPLALYLLTFVIAFSEKPALKFSTTVLLQAVFVSLCAWLLPFSTAYWALLFVIHLGTFFFTALMCHQGLAARRPLPDRLTEFYLLLSLGGVVGGAFNALLAPVIFETVREYPLVLLLALFARPAPEPTDKLIYVDDASKLSGPRKPLRQLGLTLMSFLFGRRESPREGLAAYNRPNALNAYFLLTCIVLALMPPGIYWMLNKDPELLRGFSWKMAADTSYGFFAVAGVLAFFLRRQRALMIIALTVLTICAHAVSGRYNWIAGDRSFFGILRVATYTDPTLGEVHMLLHGTTLHGSEIVDGPRRCQPMLYYAKVTPLGQAMERVQFERPEGVTAGVVGLGTGSMAAYVRPQDRLTYFEIDPLVPEFSRNPQLFNFVDQCSSGAPINIVMGDARLSLAKEPAGKYDILIIDAFSSDAVPTHLLTVEALQIYLKALKPDGVVVLHLSNRNLEITKPAIAAAAALHAPALHQIYYEDENQPANVEASTEALMLSPTEAGIASFRPDPRWTPPPSTNGVRAWTDDYTNLAGSLWRDMAIRIDYYWRSMTGASRDTEATD
jgi:predicted O-methyltransferase YrrM